MRHPNTFIQSFAWIALILLITIGCTHTEDIILKARCKSKCISNAWRINHNFTLLNDSKCFSNPECHICVGLCDNLYQDYDQWSSKICDNPQNYSFCIAYPSCNEACQAVRSIFTPSNGYKSRRIAFPTIAMHYNSKTKSIYFYWSAKVFHDVPEPIIYVAYFLSNGDAWQFLSTTMNHIIRVQVIDSPQDYAFRFVAITSTGPIASSATIQYAKPIDDSKKNKIKKDKLDHFLDNLNSREAKLSNSQDTFHKRLNKSLSDFLKPREWQKSTTTPEVESIAWMNIIVPATVLPVIIVLVALLIYTQRNHQLQLMEMRRTFTSWSSKVSSSFRNSIHSARRSIRKPRRPDSAVQCASPNQKEIGGEVFLPMIQKINDDLERSELPDSTSCA